MAAYHGIIIDKSLRNPALVREFDVLGSKTDRANGWVCLRVAVSEGELEKTIRFWQQNAVTNKEFYAHFYRGNELVVVFREKVFRVTQDKASWAQAVEYGVSLGIPRSQLTFKPFRFEDETY